MDYEIGFWAEVIYGSGDYPIALKQAVQQSGEKLKSFSDDEIKNNIGTSDFFGLNHYTSRIVRACQSAACGLHGIYGFQVRGNILNHLSSPNLSARRVCIMANGRITVAKICSLGTS